MSAKVSALHIYPVKSFQGLTVKSLEIGLKGPDHDRRLMVVDLNGRFLTQRLQPQMALVHTALQNDSLLLSKSTLPAFSHTILKEGKEVDVVVHKDTVRAIDQGDEVALWISQALGLDARIVYMPDKTFRKVKPEYAVRETDEVSFADAYPLLLTTDKSLDDLNGRLQKPIPMDRFRPNIVVTGDIPYEEDTWKKIRIGGVIFNVIKPCSRCVLTCVDQKTGEKGLEPLQTLAKYRKQEGGIMFGVNLIPESFGSLSLNNSVEIL
jgi:uncharacterized protein